MIVDGHVHLWDTDVLELPVLERRPAANRPFLAEDLDALAAEHELAGAVVVEARSGGAETEAERRWLAAETARSAAVAGVVAWAAVEEDGLADELEAVRAAFGERLVGIRRTFEFAANAALLREPATLAGVREVGRQGLPFDLVLFEEALPDAVALVERCPQTRFCLDHLGKPNVDEVPSMAWQEAIAALGALPNVVAKVSGIVSESPSGEWGVESLRPFVAHAADCFGWERLMFGGDWPICLVAGGYARWLEAARELAADASAGEQERFLSGTAIDFYGLTCGERTT